jgi:hypothetical protein
MVHGLHSSLFTFANIPQGADSQCTYFSLKSLLVEVLHRLIMAVVYVARMCEYGCFDIR